MKRVERKASFQFLGGRKNVHRAPCAPRRLSRVELVEGKLNGECFLEVLRDSVGKVNGGKLHLVQSPRSQKHELFAIG